VVRPGWCDQRKGAVELAERRGDNAKACQIVVRIYLGKRIEIELN
jgi:hypothetical protein